MKMKKKLMTALTVAAITGVCAFTVPASAGWTPDAPTKLGTNLLSSQATANDGMVAVGQDGKAYRMTKSNMGGTPSWAATFAPVTTDFVAVAHDAPAGAAAAGEFFALTSNGTLVTNAGVATADSGWSNIKLSAVNRALLDGKTIVGLACPAANNLVILASDGTLLVSTDTGANWTDQGAALKAHVLKTNGIKGVAYYDGTDILVYGATNAAKDEANLLYIDISDGSIDASIVVDGCPTITDVSAGTAYVYVAGESGKLARVAQNLGGTDTVLTVPGSPTTNFKAIQYNETETFGYAAGASGSLYRIENITVTKRDVSALTTADLNALSSFAKTDGTRRTFAAGNDGVSIYNDEAYWADVTTTTLPAGSALLTNYTTSFYTVGTDKILYASSDKGATWAAASTDVNIANKPTVRLLPNSDGTKLATLDATDSSINVYTPNTATPAAIAQSAASPNGDMIDVTVLGANAYGIEDNTLSYMLLSEAAGTDKTLTTLDGAGVPTAASSIAVSANGVYVLDGTTLKAMTGHGVNTLISTASGITNDLANVATGTAPANLPTFQASTDKLYSLTDGLAIVDISDTEVYTLKETGAGVDVTVAGSFVVTDTNYPGAAPVSISGSSTAMTVSDNTDVFYYDGTNWSKQDTIISATTALFNSVEAIASTGTNILALDSSAQLLGYTAGASFTAASGDQFPVSSRINSAFNATKSDVYVAGADGLLYNATQKAGSSTFTWGSRYQEGFFGSKNIAKVTGAAGTIFVSYGEKNAELAFKTLSATKWTEATEGPGITTINDFAAVDTSTIYVADNSNGLVKGDLSTSTFTFTKQTKTAASDAIPTGLTALSMLGSDTIYAVSGSSSTTKLTKFSAPSGNVWTVADITLPSPKTLNDVVVIAADKVYAVGDDGYAVSYDGTTLTQLSAPTSYNLSSCWAYDGVLFAGDNNGQVHEYTIATKTWTSGTVQAGVQIKDVTGSSKGEFILAVGTSGTVERSTISASGGGQTSTKVTPGVGETDPNLLDASATSSSTTTSAALTTAYKTPTMTVLGQEQTFKTAAGKVISGSTHNFQFNVTPASATKVSEVSLFKLLPVSGSVAATNITYNRVDSAPSSATDGTYWITKSGTTTVMATADTLSANTVYTVNLGIKDGGNYDTDSAANGVIVDPTVLGSTASSSSSSGCVFNPAAGFGLEWLMLMVAPLVGIFRSRFKK